MMDKQTTERLQQLQRQVQKAKSDFYQVHPEWFEKVLETKWNMGHGDFLTYLDNLPPGAAFQIK